MGISSEEITRRITAMDEMSNEQIFRKAAEIISNDPFLTKGSYLANLDKNDFIATGWRPPWVADEAEAEVPDGLFKCHCLEGSIHEAVGIYVPDEARPGWLIDNGEISYHFDKTRAKALNQLLVRVLPLKDLATLSGIASCIEGILVGAAGTIYAFSDYILAPKGKEGVRLAAQYLNFAAELAAEQAQEAS